VRWEDNGGAAREFQRYPCRLAVGAPPLSRRKPLARKAGGLVAAAILWVPDRDFLRRMGRVDLSFRVKPILVAL
jgi:hypothetical protein